MKTYYATDLNIYPQQVQARPMNSMTHAIQIEGIDPLEYDEHGLGGYYATWQEDGKDFSAWYPDDVFGEIFKRLNTKDTDMPKDHLTEVTDRILFEGFGIEPEPKKSEVNFKLIACLSVVLSAICLLGYCGGQHELELTQQELATCKIN